MHDTLQTIAEIAAAFAGFASVVVIFRRRGDVRADEDTKVTFQSMLLGALFVIFFSMLPIVLEQVLSSSNTGFFYSAMLLLGYIVGTFLWGLSQGSGSALSAVPYFMAAALIAISQLAGLFDFQAVENMYLLGVFTLLTISGYAFYSLITFGGGNDDAV